MKSSEGRRIHCPFCIKEIIVAWRKARCSLADGLLVKASVLAVSSVYCVHGAVVKGTEGHGGRGDPAAGQSSWGASQNQREGGNHG